MVLTVSPGYLTTYGRRSTMDQKDFDTWKASTASILAIFTSSNNNYTLCAYFMLFLQSVHHLVT